MEIKTIKVGTLKCNCYVLVKDHEALIIDPGDESDRIIELVGKNIVKGIIVTHHHLDHDGAVPELTEKYHVKMYDKHNLSEGNNTIGNFKFEIIYTPGHKSDLITLYFKQEQIIFCGDFIFKDSIGRTDLPDSNTKDMLNSINKIKQYPKNTKIYPGHGPETTLGYEIANNIYFNNNIYML